MIHRCLLIINRFENQDHGNRCIEKLKNIKKTTYSLPVIRENEDFANESVAYLYIGKSYWVLKKIQNNLKIQLYYIEKSLKTVSSLLKQLKKFERDKKNLEKDLTLGKLSTAFGSTSTYLSQIIYHLPLLFFQELGCTTPFLLSN